MNKNTFISELSRKLRGIPKADSDDAMNYYVEYFLDAEIDDKGLIPSLSIHITQMVLDILGVKLYEQRDGLVENYKYNHLAGNNGNKLGMSKYLEK